MSKGQSSLAAEFLQLLLVAVEAAADAAVAVAAVVDVAVGVAGVAVAAETSNALNR